MTGQSVIVWGAGGHALVVADIVRESGNTLVGFIDDTAPRGGEAFGGATVLGGVEALERARADGHRHIVIAVGDSEPRLQLAERALGLGFSLVTAAHPKATIAKSATIGAGSVITAGVVVAPEARIGANVILNTACSVDHECRLADGVHVGPGVHIGGRARIGRGAWIGIGAAIGDRVEIGEGAVIGAGAVVIDDIPARVLAYGVPAKVIRKLP